MLYFKVSERGSWHVGETELHMLYALLNQSGKCSRAINSSNSLAALELQAVCGAGRRGAAAHALPPAAPAAHVWLNQRQPQASAFFRRDWCRAVWLGGCVQSWLHAFHSGHQALTSVTGWRCLSPPHPSLPEIYSLPAACWCRSACSPASTPPRSCPTSLASFERRCCGSWRRLWRRPSKWGAPACRCCLQNRWVVHAALLRLISCRLCGTCQWFSGRLPCWAVEQLGLRPHCSKHL